MNAASVRLSVCALALWTAHGDDVAAQPPVAAPAGDSPTPGGSVATDESASDASGTPDEDEDEPSERATRHEEEGVAYRSIGVGYRHGFVPQAVIELFVEDAPRGIQVQQAALEYASRRDGFQVTASITYSDYAFEGAFLNDGDPRFDYEWLDSSLKSVGVGAGFSWSSKFSDVFAIEGGIDFGLGALFGRLRRTEAYPSLGENPRGGRGFAPCTGPTTPGGVGSDSPVGADFDASRFGDSPTGVSQYCGAPASGLTDPDVEDGEQYGVRYRTWLEGRSLPIISWRLAPRLSFRIKPAPHFVIRIDGGFDFGSGAFVGGAAHYLF